MLGAKPTNVFVVIHPQHGASKPCDYKRAAQLAKAVAAQLGRAVKIERCIEIEGGAK